MTRNEMINELQNKLEKARVDSTLTETAQLINEVRSKLNDLKIVTLADALGWGINEEHIVLGFVYKINYYGDLIRKDTSNSWVAVHTVWTKNIFKIFRDAPKVEKRYIVPLPRLYTTDGAKQFLTHKDNKFFASRRNKELRQTWKEEDLKYIPEEYRKYAVEVEDEN